MNPYIIMNLFTNNTREIIPASMQDSFNDHVHALKQ